MAADSVDLRDKTAVLILLMPIGVVVFFALFSVLAIIGLHVGVLKIHLLEFRPIPKTENVGWIAIAVGSMFASVLAVWSCFRALEKRIR